MLHATLLVEQDVSCFTGKKNERDIQIVSVAIALRIAMTSEYISFFPTSVKLVASCFIAMSLHCRVGQGRVHMAIHGSIFINIFALVLLHAI